LFERFTDRARRVLVLAQEEARLLNHNYIGTEHILLGLIHEGEGVAAHALESLGISLEAVREKVSRYCSGADRVGAALIVVLAAESQSPLSIDLLRTALTGAQTVTMSFDIFEPGPVSSGPFSMRAENIPPAFHPSVSAIAWLEPGIENPGTLTLFPIASAERQLRFRQSERLVIEQIAKN